MVTSEQFKKSGCGRILLLGSLLCSLAAQGQSLSFSTMAGNAGRSSKDATGTNALFYHPQGVATDASNNLYVADFGNNTIRKISSGGAVTTFAGQVGNARSSDGTGTGAAFNGPAGLATDAAGNVYVADSLNNTIRKISPGAVVTTLAGSSIASGSTDDTGTNALFLQPMSVAVDASNFVYVADYGNHTIRKISPDGAVTTLAGTAGASGSADGTGSAALFYQPQGVAVDSIYNVYVADTGNNVIRKITPSGIVSTLAGSSAAYGLTNGTGTNALFYQPRAVAVDAARNVFVADFFNNVIRKVTSAGIVTTMAGTGAANFTDATNFLAKFNGPQGLALSTNGLYVADFLNNAIRLVSTNSTNGLTVTIAGSPSRGSMNGVVPNVRLSGPGGLAADPNGTIYFADTDNNLIRKITNGIGSTVAGATGIFGSVDGTGTNALFSAPHGLAQDRSGNLFVADTGNGTIRKITPTGVVTTFAGTAGYFNSLDGTGTNALFNGPQGIAIDSSTNIYVTDTLNHTVRKITSTGVVTTLAGLAGFFGSIDGATTNARFYWPQGIAVDTSSNIYVTEQFNHTIRKITPAGVTTSIAALPGLWGGVDDTNSSARFFQPSGIAFGSAGKLFVVDSGNSTIRQLVSSGGIWTCSTVAGLPGVPGSSDGFGGSVRFNFPTALAADSTGNLYVADTGNNTIRTTAAVVSYTPPVIATQPQPKATAAGNSAFFTVGVSGTAPFGYSWKKNGSALSDGGKILGSATSTLTITNVQATEVASYSVVVTNLVGTASSDSAALLIAQVGSFTAAKTGVNGLFQFQINGTSGASYDLEASTNLINWFYLTTFDKAGTFSYGDFSAATNGSGRFYRLKLNP